MSLIDWFRGWFGRKPAEMVPFFDVQSRKVVRIPAAELRPGVVQVRLAGQEELVWVMPSDLQAGEVRHPPFSEDMRKHIREIKSAFAEHHPLTMDEWEDGFRRDANPQARDCPVVACRRRVPRLRQPGFISRAPRRRVSRDRGLPHYLARRSVARA